MRNSFVTFNVHVAKAIIDLFCSKYILDHKI